MDWLSLMRTALSVQGRMHVFVYGKLSHSKDDSMAAETAAPHSTNKRFANCAVFSIPLYLLAVCLR